MDKVNANYTSTTQLMDLNDDCLAQVFQYLRIGHRLRLVGRLSRRIDCIIYRSWSLLRYLRFNTRSPPKFRPQHFEVIRRSLRRVFIIGGCFRSASVTLRFLLPLSIEPRLQHLTLRYVRLTEDIRVCVAALAPHLKYLDISYSNLYDYFLHSVLEKTNVLKILTILGDADLTLLSIKTIKSTHLTAINTDKATFTPSEMEIIREKYPNLYVNVFALDN